MTYRCISLVPNGSTYQRIPSDEVFYSLEDILQESNATPVPRPDLPWGLIEGGDPDYLYVVQGDPHNCGELLSCYFGVEEEED